MAQRRKQQLTVALKRCQEELWQISVSNVLAEKESKAAEHEHSARAQVHTQKRCACRVNHLINGPFTNTQSFPLYTGTAGSDCNVGLVCVLSRVCLCTLPVRFGERLPLPLSSSSPPPVRLETTRAEAEVEWAQARQDEERAKRCEEELRDLREDITKLEALRVSAGDRCPPLHEWCLSSSVIPCGPVCYLSRRRVHWLPQRPA